MTTPDHVDETAQRSILDALGRSSEALTHEQVKQTTRLGNHVLRRNLHALVARGEIVIGSLYTPGRHGGMPRTYRLARPSAPIVRTAAMLGDAR